MGQKLSIEQAIKLVFRILPMGIYRDFDHHFAVNRINDDDLHLQLYVEVFGLNKIRVIYYGDNLLERSLHEEYWNGDSFQKFSDGGFIIDAESLTKERLLFWMSMTFRLEGVSGSEVDLGPLNRTMGLIFSELPNTIVERKSKVLYALTILIGLNKTRTVYDIRYMNTETKDHLWFDDDSFQMPLEEVSPALLRIEYNRAVQGFDLGGS